MSALAPLLFQFHEAILRDDSAIVTKSLKAVGQLSPERQMRIYIEGYRTRLINAIASDYPELRSYMGQESFEAYAFDYVHCVPPTEPSLDVYPLGFTNFIGTHTQDGFAKDLAALEGAIARVFLFADSQALQPDMFSSFSEDHLSSLHLQLRTAAVLLCLSYPLEAYFVAARAGEKPQIPEASPTGMLVLRHNNEVRRHVLHPIAFSVLSLLEAGLSVGEALEESAQSEDDIHFLVQHAQAWFAQWVGSGFFRHPKE